MTIIAIATGELSQLHKLLKYKVNHKKKHKKQKHSQKEE